MLRITTTDVGEKVTLKLEGKLSGPWVEEFERCWQMSADIYKMKGLVVDLSGVTFADPAERNCSALFPVRERNSSARAWCRSR